MWLHFVCYFSRYPAWPFYWAIKQYVHMAIWPKYVFFCNGSTQLNNVQQLDLTILDKTIFDQTILDETILNEKILDKKMLDKAILDKTKIIYRTFLR